jgi:hypothetical protein
MNVKYFYLLREVNLAVLKSTWIPGSAMVRTRDYKALSAKFAFSSFPRLERM